jgi:hypothetical protein
VSNKAALLDFLDQFVESKANAENLQDSGQGGA